MRFLLDENISQSVSRGLNDSGFSATSVFDEGLGSVPDEEIIAFARRKRLTIITHDKDFGNLIRFPRERHYGVIMLRFRDQKPQNVLLHLLRFLAFWKKSLKRKLVIMREDQVRVIE